ncbi:MAG TPA: hypothetical protein PLV68_21185, partial [Ilumatobacteraceae bacterium]|nr:hypothetical protein [Ilumatobacteraceae bacterium]
PHRYPFLMVDRAEDYVDLARPGSRRWIRLAGRFAVLTAVWLAPTTAFAVIYEHHEPLARGIARYFTDAIVDAVTPPTTTP